MGYESKNGKFAIFVNKPCFTKNDTKNFFRDPDLNFFWPWGDELKEAYTYNTFDEAWKVLNEFFTKLSPRYVVKIIDAEKGEFEIIKGIEAA